MDACGADAFAAGIAGEAFVADPCLVLGGEMVVEGKVQVPSLRYRAATLEQQ